MENQNAVSIVTVKNKIPLFKGNEKAERIELIQLEEVGFELVSQKDLYEIGDKAVYIQPDYSVSDIYLFESFIRPNGDESKSMLGKIGGQPRRIRAKKFSFHKGDGQHVYSNGILLPFNEVCDYLRIKEGFNKPEKYSYDYLKLVDLTKSLDITKYEEPEGLDKNGMKVGGSKPFPEGLYKTDENNINNLWNHIEKNIGYPVILVGTEKVDGSSTSIGVKNLKGFICSRNLEKPLKIKKHKGRRQKTLLEKILFWTSPNLNIYEEVDNDDDFVKHGKPVMDLLLAHDNYRHNYVLRGELNGGSLKGSGNKNNPASKEKANIKFFGADSFNEFGVAERLRYEQFVKLTNDLGLERVKEVFIGEFYSREGIETACNNYFKNNLIEGIVVRTVDGTFSAKFMNNEYDAKK